MLEVSGFRIGQPEVRPGQAKACAAGGVIGHRALDGTPEVLVMAGIANMRQLMD